MARFDLYAGRGGGFLLDVQTDLVSGFNTRLVVPIAPRSAVPPAMKRLHPIFVIDSKEYTMATHLMTAVAARSLGPRVGSLKHEYERIVAAIDMIFLGF